MGEIGYGIMWLFVVAMIEGTSYTEGFGGLFYHALSISAGIASIYKLVIGVKIFKNIK